MGILAEPEKVRRVISDVATDDRRGSRELAVRALRAFLGAAPGGRASGELYKSKILSIADEISRARPAMAVIAGAARRIKEEFIEKTKKVESPGECFEVLEAIARQEETRILSLESMVARRFKGGFPNLRKPVVFSYSSMLVSVLESVGKSFSVFVCESRPGLEGRKTARLLAGSVKSVRFITEAQIPMAVEKCDCILIGCDCIFPDGSVVNKIGSRMLCHAAHDSGRPVIVLGDTYKLLPKIGKISEEHPPDEIWRKAPRGIVIINEYFERIPPHLVDHIVTEEGIFHGDEIGKLIKPRRRRKSRGV